jgi:gamma-glutamyltranspeptidase/glutathione hydrolase
VNKRSRLLDPRRFVVSHTHTLAWVGIPLIFTVVLVWASVQSRAEPRRTQLAARAAGLPPSHYGVATQHPSATEAATMILRQGGSAADAAIAAALTLGVVAPDCSGIGGGGFALVWNARTRRATVLDFRETAPARLDPPVFEHEIKGRDWERRGELVGVPGELRGLLALHEKLGRLPFERDVEPAIDAAERGYSAGLSLARNAYAYRQVLDSIVPLRDLYEPPGLGPISFGAHIVNRPLAVTLKAIARDGPNAFYRGSIGRDLTDSVRAAGGWLDLDDLADYRVVEREPLRVSWQGYEVLTIPPPSAGGVLLVETLKATTRDWLLGLGLNSSAYIHELAELFRDALGDRVSAIGDPRFAPLNVDSLANDVRMAHRKASIEPFATHALPSANIDEHGTSHLVVVDGEGNLVSMTTTVGDAFGARVMGQSTGIVLNDELVDFTPERQYDLFRGEAPASLRPPNAPNAPRPGARPVSSMTPVLVLRDGAPVLALGGAGGLRIATGVTQALLARLAFEKSPAESVSLSRFHTPYHGATVELEFGADETVVKELRDRGEKVEFFPNFSAVQMVALGVNGQVEASADPRFGGRAAAR